MLFLQETHSISNDENAWAVDFKGQVFFSDGTFNSRGVLIAYLGSKSFVVKNKRNDDAGRILILDASIDGTDYILVNIYNANTETEQIKVLNNLHLLLDSLDIHQNKQIILAGDFNLFLDTTLEAEGGSPCLKKKSVAKLIKIKEHFDLCDIWRLRNPDVKQFTFRQKHASGFIQRRLDYFFISNSLQDVITHADFFAALSTDHSPVTISISKSKNRIPGHGFWKFNSSLLSDQNYVTKTKDFVETFLSNQNLIPNAQLKWELLKYEIRKFTINYSKKLAKGRKENKTLLENKLKELEGNLNTEDNIQSYNILSTPK